MVASEFLGYVQSFSVCNYVGFEDLADRANFQWNVIVLLLCMVLVTMRQYFMTPLVCYLPTTVSGVNADSYITNLCWIEGTFPINLTSGIVPHKLHEWDALRPQQMNYYQWVPLVLGLQAILYYLPRIIWSIFTYNRTGTDLQNLIRQANLIAKEDGEKRQKMVQHIAKTLELLLFSRREYRSTDTLTASFRRSMAFMPGKHHGNNLVYVYLAIKVLYSIVGFFQLYLMYFFLRFDSHEGYWFFGIRILSDIIHGKPWTETQVFPRVGMCRHTLQHVGASNAIFAQCVLPINMLNEKIYIFLFFFLGSIMILTMLSIPLWLYRMGLKRRQRHFVRRFLKIADVYDRNDPKIALLTDRFMAEFLRQDGHFILRMLSMNAGDLITVEIVCNLFADYKKRFAGIDFRGPPLMPKMHKYHDFDGYLSSHRSHDIPNDIPRSVNNDRNPPGFIRLEEGGIANVRQRPTPSAPVVSENAVPPAYQYAAGMKDPEIYPLSVVRNMPRDAPVEQSKNVMNAPKLIDDNITVNEKEQLKRLPQYTPTEV
ncbi:Innexin unc-9 [Schistosoma japonicum]|nr:Innexin unc-9 [Schistosoma japonicum]KAH8875182.1 Innexin unc-9 [Schistosoma japonicum]KAH8875183.1 Innexin unc-9 [Schistosoma japonicum]KAH8875184.1 Innexin unc-9 [Schistosoma japonicum]KAH8875185.1 Innexin unc-9 [Schistosoma japonicum]